MRYRLSTSVRLTAFLFGLVLLSWQFKTVQIAATFNPDRLRLLDVSNCSTKPFADEAHLVSCLMAADFERHDPKQPVLLVRGNAPLNERGKFDASMLVNAVEDRVSLLSKKANFSLNKPRMIVVSLLSTRANDEATVFQLERSGSISSPNVELIHAPVRGSLLSILPSSQALEWLLSFLRFDTTGGAWELSARLHVLVHNNDSDRRATIVYFHCMRGIDRTGLVAGTYAMRYHNISLREVNAANRKVGNRLLQTLEEKSLSWSYMKCTKEGGALQAGENAEPETQQDL